jgi:hypothetical protein
MRPPSIAGKGAKLTAGAIPKIIVGDAKGRKAKDAGSDGRELHDFVTKAVVVTSNSMARCLSIPFLRSSESDIIENMYTRNNDSNKVTEERARLSQCCINFGI